MSILASGERLGGKWILGRKLGEGAYAEVFEASNADSNGNADAIGRLVVKCVKLPTGKGKMASLQKSVADTLYYENTLYNGVLIGFKYAPKLPLGAYGNDKGYRYLLMQRLDCDLKTFSALGLPPSRRSVAWIGSQILEGLKILHEKGFLFVDVKPGFHS